MKEDIQLPLQIAVASYDNAWLNITARYFYEHKKFGTCHYTQRGDRLLALLQAHPEIQILVLDEHLQDIDLLEFLEKYNALPLRERPILVAMCNKHYFGYTGSLYAQGVMDCMAKPIRLDALSKRILHLHQERYGGYVKEFCDALYKEWGVSQNDSTVYLTDVIKILTDSKEHLAVRKELIWTVGEMHGCSYSAVDSGLRRLIEKLEKGNAPAYCSFKEKAGLQDKKPTVGQLVYAMREALHIEIYV